MLESVVVSSQGGSGKQFSDRRPDDAIVARKNRWTTRRNVKLEQKLRNEGLGCRRPQTLKTVRGRTKPACDYLFDTAAGFPENLIVAGRFKSNLLKYTDIIQRIITFLEGLSAGLALNEGSVT